MAVVHTHSLALIPFGITRVPLQPIYHRSAFISGGIPVFEIREAGGMTDMLIRNQALGKALATALGDRPAALMRGHGAAVVGPSLPRVVSRSIFLSLSASLQAQTMALGGSPTFLDAEEARKIEEREGFGLAGSWEAWKQKAMAMR
jgi:HCOMODA/2-hydroxy-3-carboxy-muconic semialdehyde decarboxylase